MTRPEMQLPVQLETANRRKDRSVSLRFSTRELSTAEFAAIDMLTSREGWLLFAANAFDASDVPDEDAPSELKSQAQRLRAVLFRIWKDKTSETEPFQTFYQRRTERIIRQLQEELDA